MDFHNPTRREVLTFAGLAASGAAGVMHAASGKPASGTMVKSGFTPHRIFASSRMDVDSLLARQYAPEVPFGCSGELLWATSPQGWGFADGVHLLLLNNPRFFDIQITTGKLIARVESAKYHPSHVAMTGRMEGTWITRPAGGPRSVAAEKPWRVPRCFRRRSAQSRCDTGACDGIHGDAIGGCGHIGHIKAFARRLGCHGS